MLYGKYDFQVAFEEDALLPPFKGSTLRGSFGQSLKKVVCALKEQECRDCLLKESCIYCQVFETAAGILGNRGPSPPHPFVLEPPLIDKVHFEKRERFDFSLILFGQANEYLPYFIYTCEQMGKIGLGRRPEGGRVGFQLLNVKKNQEIIYDNEDRKLVKKSASPLRLTETCYMACEPEKITISLLSPLRLKFQNHFKAELPFHILLRAALRRIATLQSFYGEGEPDLNYRELVARGQEVETVSSSIRWYDWRRYSNRQEQAMFMGGMVGQVTYRGDLRKFLPYINYGEKVHLGKGTTFGLGNIKVIEVL